MRSNLLQSSNRYQEWEVGSQYEIKKQINHISFKKAVEAVHISTGKKVIIAKIDGHFDNLHKSVRVLRELVFYRKADHPNLLKILEIIEPTKVNDFSALFVVFEYMMSNITKVLKSPMHLEITHVKHLLYQTLVTFKYLQSSGVIHRNFKPSSIMLNEDCSIKICGFDSVKTANEIGKEPIQVETPKLEVKSGKKLIKKGGGLIRRNQGLRREYCGGGPRTSTAQYRAPDLALLKKTYTSACDVWSVGCIFADLLCMMKENAPTFLDRSALFFGDSNLTLSLSPTNASSNKKEQEFSDKLEYLKLIFSLVGTPKPEDLEFMEIKFEIDELKKLPFKKGIDFAEMYSGSGPEASDLLKKMLEFNPDKRITIDECFYHPFLKTVCQKELENSARSKISLDFEVSGVVTVEKMRELFLKEVQHHKKN